jgi:hypothetical protein
MAEFELWMFPIAAGALMYVMHLVVMWRLKVSDERARVTQATAAE